MTVTRMIASPSSRRRLSDHQGDRGRLGQDDVPVARTRRLRAAPANLLHLLPRPVVSRTAVRAGAGGAPSRASVICCCGKTVSNAALSAAPDEHGERQDVEPQQHRDRGGQRTVDRPGVRGRDGEELAQQEAPEQPHPERERRPRARWRINLPGAAFALVVWLLVATCCASSSPSPPRTRGRSTDRCPPPSPSCCGSTSCRIAVLIGAARQRGVRHDLPAAGDDPRSARAPPAPRRPVRDAGRVTGALDSSRRARPELRPPRGDPGRVRLPASTRSPWWALAARLLLAARRSSPFTVLLVYSRPRRLPRQQRPAAARRQPGRLDLLHDRHPQHDRLRRHRAGRRRTPG